MEPQEYEMMFSVENQHWWYVGMERITMALLAHFYPPGTNLTILDAGCGTGAAMHYLSSFGQVTGFDVAALALHFCQQRNLTRLNRASVSYLPFKNEYFDLVTSFDVLCHGAVENYRQALNEFNRVLKPGGRILLRLPAYNWLRAHHDQVVHSVRRFTATELRQDLRTSNFVIEKLSYANTLLFPVAAGKRFLESLFPPADGSDVHPNAPWQDALLSRFLFMEAQWLINFNLPFGLTVIVIGRKR